MPLRTIASLDLEAKETALAEIARMYPQTQPTPTPTYTAASIPVASEVVPAAATVHPDEMAAAIAPIFARMDQITRQIAGIESSLAGLTNHVALTAKREEAIYTAVTKKAEPLPTEDEQSCHAYIVGLGRRYYTKNADGTPDGEDHKSSVESLLNGAGSPTNGFLPLRRLANMAYESVKGTPKEYKDGNKYSALVNTKSLLRWLSETPERGTVSRFLLIKNCGSRDELREVYGILLADRMSASDIDALFVPYGTHPLDRMAVRGA